MAEEIWIGILYPSAWELRSQAELDADLAAIAAIDERLRVVDVRYVEPDELRVARGARPYDGLREQAPALSDEQVDAFSRIEIALAQDLPFDIGTIAPRLRWVQGMGAGVGQLISAGLGDAGIRLTSAAGVNAVSISEFVLGRLLASWKRFAEIDRAQQDSQWQPFYGRELAGVTVGIIGLGAIGSAVARRLDAFDVHVLASRRSFRPAMTAPHVAELFGPADLLSMLARCDAVVAAVPESPETVGVMGAEQFAAMKPGSFFCNVGRGSLVVEEALVEALQSGHLGAAAIDVARTEPLPSSSPLWAAPRLAISAHCSTSADRFYPNLYHLFGDNIRRYLSGGTLLNEVDILASR